MDREKFEKLMGLIFMVNTTTANHIDFSHDSLSGTLHIFIYDECIRTDKMTLSMDYTLIDNDYLYTVMKCKQLLSEKVG